MGASTARRQRATVRKIWSKLFGVTCRNPKLAPPCGRNQDRPGGGDCNWAHEWTTHQRAAAREDRIAPAEQYNRILTVGDQSAEIELAEGGAGVRGISHGFRIAFCTRCWPMSLRRGFGRRKG